MFIGHYGPAFAAKIAARAVPLWVFFVAVQWVDVLWAILVLAGVEKLRIVPGFTEGSALDLYYMPITHSLPGAILLSLLFGAIVALFVAERRAAVLGIVAAASFSHWLLDLLVHVPDLALYDDTAKVGFGLWRDLSLSLPLELALLIGGAWLYARAVPSASSRGVIAFWAFVAFMIAVQLYTSFGPAPAPDTDAFAQTALVAYSVLAFLAFVVERLRR